MCETLRMNTRMIVSKNYRRHALVSPYEGSFTVIGAMEEMFPELRLNYQIHHSNDLLASERCGRKQCSTKIECSSDKLLRSPC